MINTDQIHVAMTKTCGLVETLACQSNTFIKKKGKETVEIHESVMIQSRPPFIA